MVGDNCRLIPDRPSEPANISVSVLPMVKAETVLMGFYMPLSTMPHRAILSNIQLTCISYLKLVLKLIYTNT